MNSNIIYNFQKLIDDLLFTKPSNYSFKIKSFKNVITLINSLDYTISLDNIKNLKCSTKIKDRIIEILNTNTLSELNNNNNNNNNNFSDLLTITGIGPTKAKKLLEANITLDILLNNPTSSILNTLTHHQLIGLKYYHDLKKKIPKHIIIQIQNYLNKFNFSFTICGSFRRNKDSSGDIDILIKQTKNTSKLKNIINTLTKDKFLVSHLTTNVSTKYMGICHIPNFSQYMRIDIRLIPEISYPFAILYFNGSKNNNTFMRTQAIKMNLKLNEYGLYDKNNNNILLNTEKEIYDYLNLDYKNPQDR